ncbi:MAG: glycosyltransferase family 2 protein [Methylococcaceae bacterium]|nr:glycosyltransferase family 2 protein [Methylococcaceae bacterium]
MTTKNIEKTQVKIGMKEEIPYASLNAVAGLIGNKLWIMADKIPEEVKEGLKIDGLDRSFPLHWVKDKEAFILEFLQKFNLLSNPSFYQNNGKTLTGWQLNTTETWMAGVDLADDWRLTGEHTAFLRAAETDLRPSITSLQKIPCFEGVKYQFSGLFATHRANGSVVFEFFNQQDEKVATQTVNVLNSPEYGGGTSLAGYQEVLYILTPVNDATYLRIKIQLEEQAEADPQGAFMFFSRLFIGTYSEKNDTQRLPYSSELEKFSLEVLQDKWQYFAKLTVPKCGTLQEMTFYLNQVKYQFKVNPASEAEQLSAVTHNAFDDSDIGVFAIDHAVTIGSEGLLLYGWCYFIETKVNAIYLYDGGRQTIDITDMLFKLSRQDLIAPLQKRYPNINEFSGFISFIAVKVKPSQNWLIEIEMVNGESKWLKVPIVEHQKEGVALIKDLLTWISGAGRMRPLLYDLFDQHLGPAIDLISKNRPQPQIDIQQRSFGTPPTSPQVSIIVPIYGRYDFIRYQLAHFADDSEFKANIDLIYVIDDPSIIVEATELAAVYAPVFNIPFRIVWYGRNLGFAGANNIGASVACAETLVLLNSDVLPEHSGWVSGLKEALENLPQAGMVGPLLRFADNTVQHAGMIAKQDERLPGFLLNTHPGKGQPWLRDNQAQEFNMLTAACVMLRKRDYLGVNGLDEGYIIGDFEDSDLCLALRKLGKKLWLVPEVKLWHLERQSQNLDNISSYRHLLTLYNGWRFKRKIQQGHIASPLPSKAQEY